MNRQKYHKQLRSFRQDETVPKQARSSGKDFENRPDMGKGHMVPLADKSSTLVRTDTRAISKVFSIQLFPKPVNKTINVFITVNCYLCSLL